jgi:hypothetical protein
MALGLTNRLWSIRDVLLTLVFPAGLRNDVT